MGLVDKEHAHTSNSGWGEPRRCAYVLCAAVCAVQDERGVSRDEMAAALLEVAEGRVPKDRLALKCLLEDMQV